MRILYVQPGSGGSFYCQNCLRDLALIEALRGQGHDVISMPLYLPATAMTAAPDETPIFYGAVALYLRHRFPWLQRLPRRWFALLDSWPVLRLAARFAGTTSAEGLEDLTLSMLRGLEGGQAAELRQVVEWLRGLPAEERPQVVVLSTALLAGMARALRDATGARVVCWLQDEDVWINPMKPELRGAVVRALREDAADIDLFMAVSQSYGARMGEWLGLAVEKIRVVYPGVDPAEYKLSDPLQEPRVVGFLARLAPAEGFERLVSAFLLLKQEEEFRDLRLVATGGRAAERGFLKGQIGRLKSAGVWRDVEIAPERFVSDRIGFLSELSVLVVPGSEHEAFGYNVVEAMAAGVPVVMPGVGAFAEVAAVAGCGTLVGELTAEGLAGELAALLRSEERRRQESALGRRAVEQVFAQTVVAERFLGELLPDAE